MMELLQKHGRKFLQLSANSNVKPSAVAECPNKPFSIVERVSDSDYNKPAMGW